jgi:heat shock protein HspQ
MKLAQSCKIKQAHYMTKQALFSIGQVVHHRLFNYIGVIYGVDPQFSLTEQWYQQAASSKPPKDKPWYQVLVNNAVHTTYVAEQNLGALKHFEPINHPELDLYFDGHNQAHYLIKKALMQ